MLVLMTDFGLNGPYIGQMKAVLYRQAPAIPIIDLFADAPTCNPRASAYLLAAYATAFPPGSVFLVVIDPGVGTQQRRPVVVEADGRWYVGPDNGLFSILARRAKTCRCWEITWRPPSLSNSFHGRDLFAPVAARLAMGEPPPGEPVTLGVNAWPDDLAEVVYIDHFGNAITGLRGALFPLDAVLTVGEYSLGHARTFAEVPQGDAFWYINANGLVELAVNQGRADRCLQLAIGAKINWHTASSDAG